MKPPRRERRKPKAVEGQAKLRCERCGCRDFYQIVIDPTVSTVKGSCARCGATKEVLP